MDFPRVMTVGSLLDGCGSTHEVRDSTPSGLQYVRCEGRDALYLVALEGRRINIRVPNCQEENE